MDREEIEKMLEIGKVLDHVHTKIGGSPSRLLPAIEFLLSECDRLEARIKELESENAELKRKLIELETELEDRKLDLFFNSLGD